MPKGACRIGVERRRANGPPRDQLTEDEPMVKSKPLPPVEMLREVLSYNPEAGELRWRQTVSTRAQAGSVAGCTYSNGYRTVAVHGRRCKVHRVAWLLAYGEDPGELQIDHINGDKLDNRLCNLRLADSSQNNCNVASRRGTISGYKGVRWVGGSRHWRAEIQVRGTPYRLGRFDTAEDAYAAYVAAAVRLHGEFANVA